MVESKPRPPAGALVVGDNGSVVPSLASGPEQAAHAVAPHVSRREQEVLDALGERLTNAEIAERLFVSVRTVETHVSSLLRKFGLTSRRHLATVAQSMSTPEPQGPQPLPATLTSLIGRDRDVLSVLDDMRSAPLVTLAGPAGVGKTRLAIEVAKRLRESAAVAFVDLAVCTDEPTITTAWLAALGGAAVSTNGRVGLLRRLAEHEALVTVLDNCEHVIDVVVPLILDTMAAVPTLKILATSREALAVAGERAFAVEPLDAVSAAQLFIERSSRDGSDGSDRADAAIASICTRLDRLPLAIELAAAQAGALTPQQIDARLEDRFELLRVPARGRASRHAGLETALAWSYDLLDPRERVLLDRLAVFRGWFDLEGVEAVGPGPPVELRSVVDLMTRLVRKSLVVSEPAGDQRRYRLLESVREYGWRRLEEASELADWRQRHLDWVLHLLDRAITGLGGDDQAGWSRHLDEQLANIEWAFEWSLHTPQQAARALKAVHGLQNYWIVGGGRRSAGLRWLRATTEAAVDVDVSTRTRGLVDAVLLLALDDVQAAASLLGEARAVTENDPLAQAYVALASAIVIVHGGAGDAEPDASLAAATIPRSDPRHWWARGMIGFALGQRGLYAEAAAALGIASDGFRQLGDDHLADGALSYIADLLLAADDADGARRAADAALANALRFDCASCESLAEASLALVDDAPERRLAHGRRALLLADRIHETWSVLSALDVVAAALADVGQPDDAVVVATATQRHREETGFAPVLPMRARQTDHAFTAAGNVLGDARYAAAQQQAETLSLRATIDRALADRP
jgi:predicted ATPase/DNA-binding CsgD family transcriptional regulator